MVITVPPYSTWVWSRAENDCALEMTFCNVSLWHMASYSSSVALPGTSDFCQSTHSYNNWFPMMLGHSPVSYHLWICVRWHICLKICFIDILPHSILEQKQDLLKYTHRDHHDREQLQEAVTCIENVTHELNESKRQSEQLYHGQQILSKLSTKIPQEKHVYLIRQDDMEQVSQVCFLTVFLVSKWYWDLCVTGYLYMVQMCLKSFL